MKKNTIASKTVNEKELQTLAKELAIKLSNSDKIIGLIGELGAGKTVFAKSFGKTLGVKNVASPTFIICAEHKIKSNKKLYHLDLYRLNSKINLKSIGWDEIEQSANRLVLIEWPNNIKQIFDSCNLLVRISFVKNNQFLRNVTITLNN